MCNNAVSFVVDMLVAKFVLALLIKVGSITKFHLLSSAQNLPCHLVHVKHKIFG